MIEETIEINTDKFLHQIEKLVSTKGTSYVDAVVYYCEKNNIEIETVAAMIKGNAKIKAQLRSDYEDLNYFPKTAKLPL